MKKIALLSALFLGLGLTSCDNYEEPNPPAQSNPQESVLKTDEVSVAGVLSGTYDLAELNNTATPIEVATITCTTLPEGYTMGAKVEVSANDFAKSFELPATVEAAADAEGVYNVYINADDLQGVFYENISKGPNAKAMSARVNALTINGNQVAYVGGPDNYYGPYSMTVIPFPSDLVIEDNYYLLGTINGWSVATAVKFNHSEASPYDDPVFTLAVDITNNEAAEGWWWKIVPESTYVTGDWAADDYSQYGVAENGDESLEGVLVAKLNGNEPGAGCVKAAGQYILTINMEESTYEFTPAAPYLYTPGGSNGWNQGASQMLYTNDYTNYFGYAYLDGEFKFTDAPDWDHGDYGMGAEAGQLAAKGGNIAVETAGLYWIHVDLVSMTYELTHISTIGVIGDATPAGWDASTALAPSEDFLTWTGTIAFGAGEFKFRANDDWGINLGGAYENLTQDGANLASPGEGTYMVTLKLGQLPYSTTFAN